MSFSDLAAIGGFISSLAVCGSLIYLALQVRQSDRNQRALMTQGMLTRGADIIMYMAQPDPNLVVVFDGLLARRPPFFLSSFAAGQDVRFRPSAGAGAPLSCRPDGQHRYWRSFGKRHSKLRSF
jgi:hypothetical protein